jgi:hypothetical protein
MQDLGTLPSASNSGAFAINDWGEAVGHVNGSPAPLLFANGNVQDLNALIPANPGWQLLAANAINASGQITGIGIPTWPNGSLSHAFLLNPIYKAFVQQPINADGSSVFQVKRGVIPVKFAIMAYGTQPSCTLPATIGIVKAGNGTLAAVDESTYSMSADNGSNFRIDPTACQYVYNLAASALGVGTYRVDISINGIMVGHAVFALK